MAPKDYSNTLTSGSLGWKEAEDTRERGLEREPGGGGWRAPGFPCKSTLPSTGRDCSLPLNQRWLPNMRMEKACVPGNPHHPYLFPSPSCDPFWVSPMCSGPASIPTPTPIAAVLTITSQTCQEALGKPPARGLQ